MKTMDHTIDIPAHPTVVWRVLVATHQYSAWNPFIRQLDGELRAGARLLVRITAANRRMTFKPTVLDVEEGRLLRWRGRLGVPGVCDGVHEFRLEPLPGGGTRFVQSETFSGVLVPLLGRVLDDTAEGFRAMNEALQARAAAAAKTTPR